MVLISVVKRNARFSLTYFCVLVAYIHQWKNMAMVPGRVAHGVPVSNPGVVLALHLTQLTQVAALNSVQAKFLLAYGFVDHVAPSACKHSSIF